MFRDYLLQPKRPRWHPIEFSINFDTGEIRGRDALYIIDTLKMIQRSGSTSIEPSPATWTITDPLHNKTEFAACIGFKWILDDDLEAAYPVIEDNSQEGDIL